MKKLLLLLLFLPLISFSQIIIDKKLGEIDIRTFSDKSMTWNYIDFSNYGISGKIIENFKSDEMIKTRVIMKDKSGKTLLKINSTKEKI